MGRGHRHHHRRAPEAPPSAFEPIPFHPPAPLRPPTVNPADPQQQHPQANPRAASPGPFARAPSPSSQPQPHQPHQPQPHHSQPQPHHFQPQPQLQPQPHLFQPHPQQQQQQQHGPLFGYGSGSRSRDASPVVLSRPGAGGSANPVVGSANPVGGMPSPRRARNGENARNARNAEGRHYGQSSSRRGSSRGPSPLRSRSPVPYPGIAQPLPGMFIPQQQQQQKQLQQQQQVLHHLPQQPAPSSFPSYSSKNDTGAKSDNAGDNNNNNNNNANNNGNGNAGGKDTGSNGIVAGGAFQDPLVSHRSSSGALGNGVAVVSPQRGLGPSSVGIATPRSPAAHRGAGPVVAGYGSPFGAAGGAVSSSPAARGVGFGAVNMSPAVPHAVAEMPARPPALEIRPNPANVPVRESFVHAAIREKYGLKVPAEHLLSPETRPNVVNVQQVLLNLDSVREVCTDDALSAVLKEIREDVTSISATLSKSQCDDQAYAQALDSFVAELLRLVQFPGAKVTLAGIRAAVDSHRAQLREVAAAKAKASASTTSAGASSSSGASSSGRDDDDAAAAAAGARALSSALEREMQVQAALERCFSRWCDVMGSREQQVSTVTNEINGAVVPRVAETMGFVRDASTNLGKSCTSDAQLLAQAVADEAEDFAKEQGKLEARAGASKGDLAECREEQATVRAEIERLNARLASLQDKERDTVNVLQATDMKIKLNRKEHEQWVSNCDLWKTYLDTTMGNTDKRLEIVSGVERAADAAASALRKTYQQLAAEYGDARREGILARLEAFTGIIVSTGQLLNHRIHQRDQVKEDLTEATVKAEAYRVSCGLPSSGASQMQQQAPQQPIDAHQLQRLRNWESEVAALRSDERRLGDDITRLTEAFIKRREEFEAFETVLVADGVRYDHPAQLLEEILERDRSLAAERRDKVRKFKSEVRRSLDGERDAAGTSGEEHVDRLVGEASGRGLVSHDTVKP